MAMNRKYLLKEDPLTGIGNIDYIPGRYVFCKECEKRFKKDLKKYSREGKMFWVGRLEKTNELCVSCNSETWSWYDKGSD